MAATPHTRQQRGADRREALIQAGATILETVGTKGFSARQVAAVAQVPLAATTYYFQSLDELLGFATDRVVQSWLEHGSRVAAAARPTDIATTASTLVEALLPAAPRSDAAGITARYEQLLSAARSPVVASALNSVRPVLYQLIQRIVVSSPATIALSPASILAIIDGAAIGAISEGRADPVAFITATLEHALSEGTHGEAAQPSQLSND